MISFSYNFSILTGCYDNTIHLWSLKGDAILTIPGHTQPVKCVSWIKYGKFWLSKLTCIVKNITSELEKHRTMCILI